MSSILEYLTRPNPELDNSQSATGSVSENVNWEPVEQVTTWNDFNLESLLSIYGTVVKQRWENPPETRPKLKPHEKKITNEDTFKTLLTRATTPPVTEALIRAFNQIDSDVDPILVGDGGLCPRAQEDDFRFRADLAGVQMSKQTKFGLANRCPGEIKLATKWNSTMANVDIRARPLSQIQAYSGTQWNVRYGYIITQAELCVVRVSKEEIGPGIAASRTQRTAAHAKISSIDTTMSRMSLESPSAYSDTYPNVTFRPIQIKSIPWAAHGVQKMTVRLGLRFLHMLALGNNSVEPSYPPLNLWESVKGGYVHVTTGRTVSRLPKNAQTVPDQSPTLGTSTALSHSQTDTLPHYQRCEVVRGRDQTTGEIKIGIQRTSGKPIWTQPSDWREADQKIINDERKLYFYLDDENEEQEETQREDQGKRRHKGKERMA